VKIAKARWGGVLLVCAKCEKKLDNRGFGPDGRERLSRVLKHEAGGKGPKAPFGVVSTRCLKLCPKKAVTVVDGAQPGRWLVVAPGDDLAGFVPSGPAYPTPALPE
jgi:predicted metal-binding protein